MRSEERRTLSVGDVVSAAFKEARRFTGNSHAAAALAAAAVSRILRRTGNIAIARRLARQAPVVP